MKAILAILADSYREAAASRVLWIALIGIALLLLAIAPLSLDTGVVDSLRSRDVTDFAGFATGIGTAAATAVFERSGAFCAICMPSGV